ncbi:MAG: hypothetical protein ACM3SR_00105 [Ignavibacteriales bacterium]
MGKERAFADRVKGIDSYDEKGTPKENQGFFSEHIGVQVFLPETKAKRDS